MLKTISAVTDNGTKYVEQFSKRVRERQETGATRRGKKLEGTEISDAQQTLEIPVTTDKEEYASEAKEVPDEKEVREVLIMSI